MWWVGRDVARSSGYRKTGSTTTKNRGVLGERARRGAPLEISDSGASSVHQEEQK